MADHTHIEWTDATWNPITGCSVVSPGCTNCYAMRLAGTRLKHLPSRAGLTVDSKVGPVWNGQVRLNEEWLDQPLRWKRPRRIFVCAHGDLFAENVPDEWIDKVFAVMALAPQHTFQVLTKRAARMRAWFADDAARRKGVRREYDSGLFPHGALPQWPLPNVWLGVSAEDQIRADERVPELLATPAAIRFVSAEPLLGPIDFEALCTGWYFIDALRGQKYHDVPEPYVSASEACAKLDWIIVGGESGPGARPMHPDWVRSIREQCAGAGTAFFFKQWGTWLDADELMRRINAGPAYIARNGQRWQPVQPLNFEDAAFLANVLKHPIEHQSDGSTMLKLDKGRAGRLLDGVVHNAMPQVRS